jgi:hypothetical protein
MSTLTLRLADEKHARLRQLASAQGVSMNHLMDELATISRSETSSVQPICNVLLVIAEKLVHLGFPLRN